MRGSGPVFYGRGSRGLNLCFAGVVLFLSAVCFGGVEPNDMPVGVASSSSVESDPTVQGCWQIAKERNSTDNLQNDYLTVEYD